MVNAPITTPLIQFKRMKKRVRVVNKSFLKDGLLQNVTLSEEFEKFGDEHQNFRDYSLQSLIQAEAIDLLKPTPSVKLDSLASADAQANSLIGRFDQLYDLKMQAESDKVVSDSADSSNE